ncbi:MAG: CPBP family intramembrane glutamic endopeptidase [Promethearchaeota archaeon]
MEEIRSSKGEIVEALFVWAIIFIILTYSMIQLYFMKSLPFFLIILFGFQIDMYFISTVLLSIIFLRVWRKGRDREDAGFNLPRNSKNSILMIIIFIIYSIGIFFFLGGEKTNILILLYGIINPAIIEEVIARSLITSKLERSLGIKKAWFFGGLLFGMLHIPIDFFGYNWFAYGQQITVALTLLAAQIISGWILCIIFIKTRSIISCILVHYIFDFLPNIFASLL